MKPRKLREDWLVRDAELQADGGAGFVTHGTMRVTMRAPTMPNVQQPHDQDELYLVTSGSGRFTKEGETRSFGAGDLIFVEAGADHQFDEVTSDMKMWIVFWGEHGGEKED